MKPILKLGSSGTHVKNLQVALTKQGFLTSADGKFGPITDNSVRRFQAAFKLLVDGVVGPITWASLDVPPPTKTAAALTKVGLVDDRSEKVIAKMHPHLHDIARTFVHTAAAEGITIKLISGLRTYEEQTKLFNQARDGKDNNGNGKIDEAAEKVTNAPAGYSNHNFGLAWDVGVFQGSTYLGESPLYAKLLPLGRDLGLECGGDWTSFKDYPHYQRRPAWAKGMSERNMLAELRRRREKGIDAFV